MPLIGIPGAPGFFAPGGLLEVEGGLYSDAVSDGLSPSWVEWRGLVIAPLQDTSTPFHLSDITGWDETPSITFDDQRLPSGYGMAVTAGYSGPRIVTVTGWCNDQVLRNKLLAIFRGNTVPSVATLQTDTLSVTHGGLTLTADAQMLKADATAEVGWGLGRFGFTLQFRCPDPLRYGQALLVSAPITPAPGGVSYPLTYPVVYPAGSPSGALVLTNVGTSPAPVVFTVQGPVTGPGLVNVTTGKQVTYGFDLVAGDVLTVDSRAGAAFLNGVYRAPLPGSARVGELVLPVGVSTVQAMGTAPSGTPSVSASYRPTYW